MCFQELCRKARFSHDSGNEIIWCNSKFRFNGEPLAFKHWSKANITHVSDLLKHGQLKEGEIYNKLIHKAGFFFEISKIKSSLPADWMVMGEVQPKKHNIYEQDVLSMEFQVPRRGIKKLENLTLKDIYDTILLNKKVCTKSKDYWTQKFDVPINWECWYHFNFINKSMPRKCKDFNWRIFYGQINTEMRLAKMKLSDGICKICNNEIENLEHLLFKCTDLAKIWGVLTELIIESINSNFRIIPFYVQAGYFEEHEGAEIINALLTICRWGIWKRRNMNKYEQQLININQCIQSIKSDIRTHMDVMVRSNIIKSDTKEMAMKVKEATKNIYLNV